MAGGLLDQAQTARNIPPSAAPAGAPLPDATSAPTLAAGAPPPDATSAPGPGADSLPPGLPQGGKATGKGVKLTEEPATPEEQAEYEKAMSALAQVLYSNEQMSNSIVDQIDPDDKVGSTAKVSMLLVQQLDKKVDFDEIVVAEVTQETVTRIIELAETRHGIEYGDDEMQVILSATWEGVSEMFGGLEENDMQELTASVGEQNLPGLKQNHEAALRG